MLTCAASQSIPTPVRFGGEVGPEHQVFLRFGLMKPDGSVRGAVVWDPLLECSVKGDQAGAGRLAAQLDSLSAVLGRAGRSAT